MVPVQLFSWLFQSDVSLISGCFTHIRHPWNKLCYNYDRLIVRKLQILNVTILPLTAVGEKTTEWAPYDYNRLQLAAQTPDPGEWRQRKLFYSFSLNYTFWECNWMWGKYGVLPRARLCCVHIGWSAWMKIIFFHAAPRESKKLCTI